MEKQLHIKHRQQIKTLQMKKRQMEENFFFFMNVKRLPIHIFCFFATKTDI